MMNPIIEAKKPEIIALCRQYGVSKLDLFGSAAGPNWSPETSDFDFVVAFENYGPGIATRLVGFCDALEALLGRPVDLVFDRSMKPRVRAFIAPQRQPIYERIDRTVAA
jgi:predicted nucleotidyltransferase